MSMDKGCRVVGCDELPVVEASVIVSRATDVANIVLQHNQFSNNQKRGWTLLRQTISWCKQFVGQHLFGQGNHIVA